MNVGGKKINEIIVTGKQVDIDLSKQAKGIYLINVITNEGVTVKKIVIK